MQRKLMILSILAVVALVILNLVYKEGPEPDAEYQMANRNIVWYYAGK